MKLLYRLSLPVLAMLGAMLSTQCQQSHYNAIPRSGFITHYAKTDGTRMAFDSYWDISDNKDWNERVLGTDGKSQAIYIAPVTTEFFQNMPEDEEYQKQIEALRTYFNNAIMKALKELDAGDNSFHLVDAPGKNAYSVQIALLSATPTDIKRNIFSTTIGFIVRFGGLLSGRKEDAGSISMGAKFFAPNGELVAEVADFEYGQRSVVGMVLADAKDFQRYAYHRRAIDEWVRQFVEIFTTVHETKITKPWFKLNPF